MAKYNECPYGKVLEVGGFSDRKWAWLLANLDSYKSTGCVVAYATQALAEVKRRYFQTAFAIIWRLRL